jgi:hypothetical protein
LLVAPGAYPRRKHLKGPPIGFALALSSNSKTQLERLTKGNPSSLLDLVISKEGEKFNKIDTRRQHNRFVQEVVDGQKKFILFFDDVTNFLKFLTKKRKNVGAEPLVPLTTLSNDANVFKCKSLKSCKIGLVLKEV